MQRKIVLALLLLTIHGYLLAQISDTIVLFEKNQIAYLLADSVNIRKEPNTNSTVVAKLAIGTKIKILDKSNTASKINNITMPWYLVQFNNNEKGYVWGGKIAQTSFRSNKNTDIVFHFGLDKVENGDNYYQIRVEYLNKELQRLSFKAFSGYQKRHTCTNISNKGLSSIDDIIQVDGFGESCGDDAGSIVFFWSNKKLYFIEKMYDEVDGEFFSRTFFIYPSDMEGEKDCIVKKEEIGEALLDENNMGSWNGYNVKYEKNKRTVYKWNGSKLVPMN